MRAIGYGSVIYGESYREFGEVITLPRSRIQVLKRQIDGSCFDLVGLYPFNVSGHWSALDEDVESIRSRGAVSIVLVADPFAEQAARDALSHWSVCTPFKTQFVVNLREDWRAFRAKNVRNSTSQALRRQTFEVAEKPVTHAKTFWDLYSQSIERHAANGIQRLSQKAIATQLGVEGAILVLARRGEAVCGAMMSYDQGEVGHLHLVGQSQDGRTNRTSYGLIYRSLEVLEARGCIHANLGGPPGLVDDPEDGLARFKSRWARHRRTSLLCGQVLDPEVYESLVERSGCQPGTFFPVYRTPGGRFEWRPAAGGLP